MLMGVGLGAVPTNLTSPLTVAVPAGLLAEMGGFPAFTRRPLEMQKITVKATARMRHFVFIQPYLPLGAWDLFSPLKFAGTLLAPDEVSLQSKEGEDAVVIAQSTTCHFRVSFFLRFDDNSMTTVLRGTSRYPQPSTASQSIAACFCLGKAKESDDKRRSVDLSDQLPCGRQTGNLGWTLL